MSSLPTPFPSSVRSTADVSLYNFLLHPNLLRHRISSCNADSSISSRTRVRLFFCCIAHAAIALCVFSIASSVLSPKTHMQLICSSYLCLHKSIIYIIHAYTHTTNEYILHLYISCIYILGY